ncbi:GAF domain-containing protein [Paucibacter soli]|uniref:GAF domain-containing protein n=1 Tax=Paucibacter soli TaxID=3133433 RepID=UPI0030B72568
MAMLEFSASQESLAALEAQWVESAACGPAAERLRLSVALAWQLRQREPQRAQRLVAEAQAQLPHSGLAASEQQRLVLRLQLTLAELAILRTDLAGAEALLQQVLRQAAPLAEPLACADAHALRATIAALSGVSSDQVCLAYEQMLQALGSADATRQGIAEAGLVYAMCFRSPEAARQRWEARTRRADETLAPAEAASVEDALGLLAGMSSAYADSIRHFARGYELSLASGQLRRAVAQASNAGVGFMRLNDLPAAAEWLQRGLELARRCRWPSTLALALVQAASVMRDLQRQAQAREMLNEALALLKIAPAARSLALALKHLGSLELDSGRVAEALDCYQHLERQARALDNPDLQGDAWLGQARALRAQGELDLALQVGGKALLACKAKADQIGALMLLAEIHVAKAAASAGEATARDGQALACLCRALALADSIEGYATPGALHEALAREYAAHGDAAQACRHAQRASRAYEQLHGREATNRVIAMEVSQETERARVESLRQAELAQSHNERNQLLVQAQTTLEQLGRIGRELTSNLETEAVCAALCRGVGEMLDMASLLVFRPDADGLSLRLVYGVADGHSLGEVRCAVDDPDRRVPRCARTREEIVIEDDADDRFVIPGTRHTRSKLYAPLLDGDRLLGVLSIQAFAAHAYGERERSIFRSLCAYAAIALANADVLAHLQQAQAELAQRERLAVLGQMISHVAQQVDAPVAAIRGAGRSLGSAVDQLFDELPRLLPNGAGRASSHRLLGGTDIAQELAGLGAAVDSLAQLVQALKRNGASVGGAAP